MSIKNNNTPYLSKTTKEYSNVSMHFQSTDNLTSGSQLEFCVVAPTTTQGVRKVKNITLTISATPITNNEQAIQYSLPFVLVYVPNGTKPAKIGQSSSDDKVCNDPNLYLTPRFIISQGLLQPGKTKKVYNHLARNLNAGDSIYLLVRNVYATNILPNITGISNYVIAYNN